MIAVEIVEVLDGDTLKLKGLGSLRLAGIDAPEKGQQTLRGGVDAGRWSKKCLERLVRDDSFKLSQEGRDIYGRMLGELHGKERLSWLLVRLGCASTYPWRFEKDLELARLLAMRERKGLWQFGGFERPYQWRKRNKKARTRRARRPGR